MANDITAANAVFLLSIPLVLPVATQLQGFAADDIFDVDDIDSTDIIMGVDGVMSGGMIYTPKPMNIALQADSPSLLTFEAWYQAQQSATAVFPAQGTVTFPALGRSYTMVTGMLSRYKPMADAKRVLQPRRMRITWQSIIPNPVSPAG